MLACGNGSKNGPEAVLIGGRCHLRLVPMPGALDDVVVLITIRNASTTALRLDLVNFGWFAGSKNEGFAERVTPPRGEDAWRIAPGETLDLETSTGEHTAQILKSTGSESLRLAVVLHSRGEAWSDIRHPCHDMQRYR
jgi:hypothetical protein